MPAVSALIVMQGVHGVIPSLILGIGMMIASALFTIDLIKWYIEDKSIMNLVCAIFLGLCSLGLAVCSVSLILMLIHCK